MDDKELARGVAAELGGDIAAETERALRGEPPASDGTRAFGLTESIAVGSFIASIAQLAVQIYQARQDRALLLQALVERGESNPGLARRLDPEKRLSLIGRIVNRLIPDGFGASPSLDMQSARTKQAWLADWLGLGTRSFTPTVLMPFRDMDNFIVYQPITWTPPEKSDEDLPRAVTVPQGFVTDLATIPNYFWWALPPKGRYGHAAILHDWLYWEQRTSRAVADRVFDVAMDEMGVALPVRKALWASVRVYGGNYWVEADAQRKSGGKRVLKRLPDSPAVTWEDWRQRPGVFE
jgi:hypothetical protein